MDHRISTSSNESEVGNLFASVFTASEGEAEQNQPTTANCNP